MPYGVNYLHSDMYGGSESYDQLCSYFKFIKCILFRLLSLYWRITSVDMQDVALTSMVCLYQVSIFVSSTHSTKMCSVKIGGGAYIILIDLIRIHGWFQTRPNAAYTRVSGPNYYGCSNCVANFRYCCCYNNFDL